MAPQAPQATLATQAARSVCIRFVSDFDSFHLLNHFVSFCWHRWPVLCPGHARACGELESLRVPSSSSQMSKASNIKPKIEPRWMTESNSFIAFRSSWLVLLDITCIAISSRWIVVQFLSCVSNVPFTRNWRPSARRQASRASRCQWIVMMDTAVIESHSNRNKFGHLGLG